MQAMLLIGVALAIGAPALKEKEKPALSLVGEWVIEQCTVGGKMSAPDSTPNRWRFNADGARSIVASDGREVAGGVYTADAKGGTLDLLSSGAPEGPYLCLYKVDGDTLTLNVGWQKEPRPAALESPPDSKCTLYVMKRVKPKD